MADPTELSPEVRQRRRQIYVRQRFFVLREEMAKAVQETQALVDTLSSTASALAPAERAKAQQRLIYLREHWPNLKAEFEAIRSEHRGGADEKPDESGKKKIPERKNSDRQRQSKIRAPRQKKISKARE